MLRLCETTPDSQREAELRHFLCERYWLPETEFPLCGDVFRALRIVGDDCQEFMNAFSEAFDIDLYDFIWPKYHLGENEAMDVRAALRPLRRFAGIRTQPLDRDLIPISIEHLMNVVERRSWFDPEFPETGERASLSKSLTRIGARLKAGGVPRRLPR